MACNRSNGFLKQVVSKPELRAQLLANPAATLKANGITVPDGAKVVIHDVPPGQPHLILPEKLDQWDACCGATEVTAVVKAVFADPALRTQLFAAPGAVFAAVLGKEFPPAGKMLVFANTASEFHLVIPVAGKELSDAELAAVAGGSLPGGAAMDAVCGILWHTRIGCNPLCCDICNIFDCIHHATG